MQRLARRDAHQASNRTCMHAYVKHNVSTRMNVQLATADTVDGADADDGDDAAVKASLNQDASLILIRESFKESFNDSLKSFKESFKDP